MSLPSGFRADIQGLRAVAVIAVLLYHAGIPGFSGGLIGVDVFFVISGFLITGHLIREYQLHRRVRLGLFYARRARRILPAAFAVIMISVVVALFALPPLALPRVLLDATAASVYVPNVLLAVRGIDYLAVESPSLFQHYWSLGVEEQFYLVWPILIVLFLAFFSRKKFVLVAALVVGSFIMCVVLTTTAQPWAFFSLPTRAWEFGIGALVAFLGPRAISGARSSMVALLTWVVMAVLICSMVFIDHWGPFPGMAVAVPVISTAALIYLGQFRAHRSTAAMLGTTPMQFIGMISYSLYLVHWPLLIFAEPHVSSSALPFVRIGLIVVAVPIAYLLFLYVETPFRTNPRIASATPRRILYMTAVASASIAIITTALIPAISAIPLDTGRAASPSTIDAQPKGGTYVPSNLKPDLRAAADDVSVVYGMGCHRDYLSSDVEPCNFGNHWRGETVALFGDSHAAQWVPALTAHISEVGYRLITFTKSACPSIDVAVFRGGSPYSSCTRWREGVIDYLRLHSPDLVIIANSTRYSEAELPGGVPEWLAGTARTVEELQSVSSRVVLLRDTPSVRNHPPTCLSRHLENAVACGEERVEALSSRLRIAEQEANIGRAEVVDVNDLVCSTFCPAIIGNMLVYRDTNHLSATFAASLGDELVQRLGITDEPLIGGIETTKNRAIPEGKDLK